MFQLIGACFDGGAKFYGSRLGPQAIRLAGINYVFKNAGIPFLDTGDVSIKDKILSEEPIKGLNWGKQFYPTLIQKTEEVFQNKHVPLIIGGDQSVRLATLTASLNQYDLDELGIIWIDPYIHLEISDHFCSFHKTILSYLVRMQTNLLIDFPFLSCKILNLNNIAFIGGEYYGSHQLFNQSADRITKEGTFTMIERLSYWIKRQNIKKLWISFNIQSISEFYVLDETPVLGLTTNQAFSLAKGLNNLCFTTGVELTGIDILEINPTLDLLNKSSHTALQWLIYLLKDQKSESFSKKRELSRIA